MIYSSTQAKSYTISSRLDTTQQEIIPEVTKETKPKKRNGFESETSADEVDTDNEMTFIKNPNGRENKVQVELGDGMAFLTRDDESDSENENGLMDKLATAIGHLFTE